MTLLHLLTDGALAAAQLLALLLVPPATAQTAPATAAASVQQPVQLHHLSGALDVQLYGALAAVRVTQQLHNAGTAVADLAPWLPAADASIDSLRVVRGEHAVELLDADGCGDGASTAGHALLTADEAIADALRIAPGAAATLQISGARPLVRSGSGYRIALPAAFTGSAPYAALVDQDDAPFLLLVVHRAANARVVLRPQAAPSVAFDLGAVDPGIAVLIPVGQRPPLDHLPDIVELELIDAESSYWTTLIADRAERLPLQAGVAD